MATHVTTVSSHAHKDGDGGPLDDAGMNPAAPASRVFEARGVAFRYASSAQKRGFQLTNCNLIARSGLPLGILGPSGAGKSTVLRILTGHVSTTAGSVFLDDDDITSRPPGHRGVVCVYQEHALFPHLSAWSNIAFGLQANKRLAAQEIARRVDKIMRQLEIESVRDVRPAQMSMGQQQRVALGRAIVVEPAVLLLDEPTASLDARQRDLLLGTLKHLLDRRPEQITIAVSHDRDFLLALCPNLAVMAGGSVLALGPAQALIEDPPSPAVAAILGFHSELRGIVRGDHRFEVLGDTRDIGAQSTFLRAKHIDPTWTGRRCVALVRNTSPTILPDNDSHRDLPEALIVDVWPRGNYTQVTAKLCSGALLNIIARNGDKASKGHRVRVLIEPAEVRVFPPQAGGLHDDTDDVHLPVD